LTWLLELVSIANYIPVKKSIVKNPPGAPSLSRSVRQGGDFDLARTTPHTVADRLHSAAIHLLRRVRKQDAATGEGPARLSALSVLVFGGPKTLGELAAAEQVKPPTMSRIVAGLARSRLIEIKPDAHDARRLRIRATSKGTRLLQKGRDLRIADLAQHLDALTPNELAKLNEAVEILRTLLANWQ
jgi:DNA-binding MarR family transcriptional regulator